jgi:hypothetical protein
VISALVALLHIDTVSCAKMADDGMRNILHRLLSEDMPRSCLLGLLWYVWWCTERDAD